LVQTRKEIADTIVTTHIGGRFLDNARALVSGTNLAIWNYGAAGVSYEIERMLTFPDWLRRNKDDRELYARSKRSLAQQEWKYTQNYADAKTAVIAEIMSRANSPLYTQVSTKQYEVGE